MSRFDLNQSIFVSPYGMSVGTPVAEEEQEIEAAPQAQPAQAAPAAAHPQRAGNPANLGGMGGRGAAAPATAGTTALPLREMDDEWRRWIAENVLLGNDPNSIFQAMVQEGFGRETAASEVRGALDHPYILAARQHGAGAARPAAGPNLENRVKKRDWVLEIYRRSARQASTFGKVPRVPKLSRQAFLDDFYSQNKPVVMEGAMDDWRALTEWTADNLKRRLGDRIIEVQANRNSDTNYEINQTKLKQDMPFGEFVDITESAGQTNNWYITANNTGKNLAALRELWDDIVLFPDYLRGDDPGNRGFFWFGPAGTVTPLHHDLTNNFMAQVRGRKLVRLVAPYDSAYVYNNRHCYSAIDLDRIDYDRFPLFREATVIDLVIGPGDLFFLPVGWWHYVRGMDISITMTFTNFVYDNDFYSMYTTYQDV
jgi:hypothetical protein